MYISTCAVPHAHCACGDELAGRRSRQRKIDRLVASFEEYRRRTCHALDGDSRNVARLRPLGWGAAAFTRFAVGQEFMACRAVAREASEGWWAVKVSNLRPSACKADALPAELTAQSRQPSPARCIPALRRGASTSPHCCCGPTTPDRKRLSTARREGPGRTTTRAKYEIRFTEWGRAGRPHRGGP